MNVLFVLVDALRPDHLGCYGYCRDTSPTIDSLARRGVRFEQAVSHASYTLPSLKAIFSSSYATGDNLSAILSELEFGVKTMPQCFQEHNYATAAVIGNFVLTREFINAFISSDATGFDKGFDFYDDTLPEREPNERREKTRGAESIAGSAIDFLNRFGDRDFFLFLHFMDCHAPYAPPQRFIEMFLNDRFFDGSKRLEISDLNFGFGKIPRYAALGSENRVDYYVAAYDAAIRYVDECIGLVLSELRSLGIDDRTMVVLTSDHGEALGEHNTFFCHGLGLYEDTIRVPLIIRAPGIGGTRVSALVRLVDLMPTVLEASGIGVPSHVRGKSLLPLIRGEVESVCGEAFGAIRADLGFRVFESMLYCVREERWKLIRRETVRRASFWVDLVKRVPVVAKRFKNLGFLRAFRDTVKQAGWMLSADNPGVELYDLERDPCELNNLAGVERTEVKRLSAKLDAWLSELSSHTKRVSFDGTRGEDRAVIMERLRSLGYI